MSRKGQDLYIKAKKIIPNGNMLLSKRPENFLPDLWPSYFSEASGCIVKDLDGNDYIDFSIMGIGTNILGYGNKYIDDSVKLAISKGVSSTLNCPEEVYLAEKLLELNSWADKVRFARTGGELNSLAIRLARSATGKEKVLVCGYHGWHDWYLASNLKDKTNLDEHLLDGLNPSGVPKSLIGTTIPFSFNDTEEFLKLVNLHSDIAAVKIEVQRNFVPDLNFLNTIRKTCSEKGIVLIFDECTSGFRETFGGIFSKYNVNPDIALFSKALGNGYAICAAVGIEEIMDEAKKTFISSTFWTERIGPVAGLATLKVMEEQKSWEIISQQGSKIKELWSSCFSENNINAKISGLDALPRFDLLNTDHNKIKTLITYLMLREGYLANDTVYVSTKHDDKVINDYNYHFNKVISKVKLCVEDPEKFKEFKIKEAFKGFQRLN